MYQKYQVDTGDSSHTESKITDVGLLADQLIELFKRTQSKIRLRKF